MRTLLVSLLLASAGLASNALAAAEIYKVSLAQPSMICGKKLPAGDYKLMVDGETASFQMGKTVIDVPVKRIESNEMATHTLVRYQTLDGVYRIREVLPKGTQMKLTFSE